MINLIILKRSNNVKFLKTYVKPKTPEKMTISKLRIMKKKDLELLGRKHGIELDRRYHKETLVNQLFNHINQ